MQGGVSACSREASSALPNPLSSFSLVRPKERRTSSASAVQCIRGVRRRVMDDGWSQLECELGNGVNSRREMRSDQVARQTLLRLLCLRLCHCHLLPLSAPLGALLCVESTATCGPLDPPTIPGEYSGAREIISSEVRSDR